MLFKIHYGLGGGFGGAINHETLDFEDAEDAELYAWKAACEEYEQYDGMHGLQTVEEIMEEENVPELDAQEMWEEHRESWLDYRVEELSSTERWKVLLDAEPTKVGQTYI